MQNYFRTLPKLYNVDDDIKNLPTVGYINDEGYTVLPKEEDE